MNLTNIYPHELWTNVPRIFKLQEGVSQCREASSVSQMGQELQEEAQLNTPFYFTSDPRSPICPFLTRAPCFLELLPGSPTFPELVHGRNVVWQVRTRATYNSSLCVAQRWFIMEVFVKDFGLFSLCNVDVAKLTFWF